MHGTGRLGGIQKQRYLALHHALGLLSRSLLPFSLHCCGQLALHGITACQGSLPDNWRYSAPLLFPHLHSPAFRLAPGGSSITPCLQGAVFAHAPAAASWRFAPKAGSSFCSWGFALPLATSSSSSAGGSRYAAHFGFTCSFLQNCLLLWVMGDVPISLGSVPCNQSCCLLCFLVCLRRQTPARSQPWRPKCI